MATKHCAYHLDLHEGFIAVIEQITRFPAVDSDDAEEQLAAQSQRHRRLVGLDNGLDTVFDVGLQNVVLRELALQVRRQPYSGKGPCLRQKGLRVEHC